MKITLKNVQVNERMSDETTCFSATVYVDGVRAGTVMNHGCGGCNDYDFDTTAIEAYAKTFPAIKFDNMEMPESADTLIGDVLTAYELAKIEKRWCRKNLVFKLKSDAADAYRTLKQPYSATAAAWVRNKYPDTLDFILNEKLAQA